jgi:hypothetical protein
VLAHPSGNLREQLHAIADAQGVKL